MRALSMTALRWLGRGVQKIVDRLVKREPVLFFGAVGAWVAVASGVKADSPAGVALAGTILLFQRAYSTSKATAEENADIARYAGALEGESRKPAPRKAPAKKP